MMKSAAARVAQLPDASGLGCAASPRGCMRCAARLRPNAAAATARVSVLRSSLPPRTDGETVQGADLRAAR